MFFLVALIGTANILKDLCARYSLNKGANNLQFMEAFTYLGSSMMLCLTEHKETDARIKRAKSQMGMLRHFFSCKDIKLNIKYWIYMARPLNILGWGSEAWNLSKHN